MPGELKLKITADASQAERAIAGLEKQSNKQQGRGVAGLSSGNNKAQAAGVGSLNKELERLVRLADNSSRKVKELEANLKRVGQQKASLMGYVESGAASDQQIRELEAVRRYERQKSRSLGHWQQEAADRAAAVEGARPSGGGNEPGPERRSMWSRVSGLVSDLAGGGLKAALPEGQLGEFAGGIAGMGLGPLAGLGLGAAAALLVKKAYDAASQEQKLFADFIPRQGLGGAGFKDDPAAFMGQLRDFARPMGFSGVEGLQMMQAMSAGGSKGMGLNADTKAAMQFARVFGVDGGQAATMLGAGERTGAFKSGDAKRFAEMLAREIAITGLGPRAQEVQEATLSLLNQQLQTQASSTPGAIMALQSVFNKTGIPALQGANGGSILARLNQAVTDPGDDAGEAINQAVYKRLGIKNYYAMERAQEKGIAQPGYLSTLFKLAEEQGNPDEQQHFIRSATHRGFSMNQVAALQKIAPGGKVSALFSSGRFSDIERQLQKTGLLDATTAKAMGLPGNQLRQGEATANDLFARAGTPIVKRVGDVAQWAEKQYGQLMNIAQSTHNLAERFMPGHLATEPDGKGGYRPTKLEKGVLNPAGNHLMKAWDWLTDQGEYSFANRKHHRGTPPPALPTVPGSGAPQTPTVGAFRPMGTVRHHHTHEHVITEHGVVSHSSKEALRRTIRQVTAEETHNLWSVSPKSGYRGHRE